MFVAVRIIDRFLKDEAGATAIEYGLIAGLISISVIAGATVIGKNLNTNLNTISTNIKAP